MLWPVVHQFFMCDRLAGLDMLYIIYKTWQSHLYAIIFKGVVKLYGNSMC